MVQLAHRCYRCSLVVEESHRPASITAHFGSSHGPNQSRLLKFPRNSRISKAVLGRLYVWLVCLFTVLLFILHIEYLYLIIIYYSQF